MSPMKMKYVLLMVSDLARSERFYKDLLGLSVYGTIEGEFVFFNTGGDVQLVIREFEGPVNADRTEFSFEVPDIMKAYQEFLSKGIEFTKVPRAVTGDGNRELYATDFRDPDGHILSITGWVQKGKSV